ncbi:MAG: serine--tRNA ligase, partial [Verrucomicrobiota bacterium]
MLDIKLIRSEPDRVREALKNRGMDLSLDPILELDQGRRKLLTDVEAFKHQRTVSSKNIGKLKKDGADISELQQKMRDLGDQIDELDKKVRDYDEELGRLLLTLPNLPHESAPVGLDETANEDVKTWGEKKTFDFEPRSHVEIGEQLGLFAFDHAAKMTGSGFPMFVGKGAKLQRALIQYMLDIQVEEHGYLELSPPFLCNHAAMTGTGQLPKMAEDMYHLKDDDLYLIPTAEVPVTNFHMDEIISDPLPRYFTAYTPCFRREAGAAGRDTRGMIRVHQFDKVEMVKIVEPDKSFDELESLLADAEDILQRLGLNYRVLSLCSGDLSFAASKC